MTAPSQNYGFTLIELLISVAIIILLTGGGIAAFIRFNDRQGTQLAARQLQTYLRSAQTKARAGEIPSGCDRLTGYRVQTTANTAQISLSAICQNGTYLYSNYSLPNNVVAEGTYSLTFANLYGGVSGATTLIVKSTGITQYRYGFSVTQAGEIKDGSFL